MQLLIKQRVFSFTDTYDVYDENQNQRYFVKGELFSFGHKIHVFDQSGKEIGSISEKIFKLFPTLFAWGDTYVIDYHNPDDEIMGLLLVIAIDAANCTNNKN